MKIKTGKLNIVQFSLDGLRETTDDPNQQISDILQIISKEVNDFKAF